MSEIARREVLGLGGGAVLAGLAATSPAGGTSLPSRGPQQNMVLFMPDELRADALACYGNPVTRTPNYDKLAAQGTRFANCHVQFSVCGASRCSLLTGWPASVRGHRSLYYFLRPEEPNMFRYLRDAGYDVYFLGKNDALAAASFADSVTFWSERGKVTPATEAPYAALLSMGAYGSTPGSYSFLYPAHGKREGSGDYALVQAAIDLLKRKETDRPFCIFIAMGEPHPPYTCPAEFYDMYDPARLPPLPAPGTANKPDFHAGIRKEYKLDALSPDIFRKIRAVYYGQVSYSDFLLGEVMEAMESTGRDKDTALFVLSDHGDYAGDYGLVEKWPSGLEDALTHVPLIARIPGQAPTPVSNQVVELYDVMATCLELAGTMANHTHFARSLLPQIRGGAGDPNRAAFAEGGYNVYEPQCFEPINAVAGPYVGKLRLQNNQPQMVSRAAAVRTATHKLISRPNGVSELYDCVADPQQINNLFGERRHAPIRIELQQRLLNWYVNTTGVAPYDKDSRSAPPFYPTAAMDNVADLAALLDH